MADNRNIKSRKRVSKEALDNRREAKSSLVNKVNTQTNPTTSKSTLASKVNHVQDDVVSKPTRLSSNKANDSINNKSNSEVNSMNSSKSKPKKNRKPKSNSKFANSFFFKLSKVGRVMLVVYAVVALFIGYLGITHIMNRGEVIIGSRELPIRVISDEQVNRVQNALNELVPEAQSISVDYIAFRLIIIAELADDATVEQARNINTRIYEKIDELLPIAEYFHATEETTLNNDLFIYSTDNVPTNFETTSRFIIQTYRNSRMSAANTHDLLTPRDRQSADEVLETMRQAGQ